jgi:hypothetical protein
MADSYDKHRVSLKYGSESYCSILLSKWNDAGFEQTTTKTCLPISVKNNQMHTDDILSQTKRI